jgi:ubiquinone/menaquinone biosynthesis C-methylase UbiE
MRLVDFLKVNETSLSAIDVMQLYYRRYSGTETFNYFAFRFGQPRHLAALSLARLLNNSPEPVLDLACGVGHITHFLAGAQPGRVVVGVDRDFVRLWIATRYVAPGGWYVCASADAPLPFSEGLFQGIFCSDAFHYFLHRAASLREMRRLLTPQGILILARFGNAAVEPREGYELSLDGYDRLLHGLPHVFTGEDAVVSAYARRSGADLSGADTPDQLARQKWLSVVASSQTNLFRHGESFDRWPHAVGRLQINPVYVVEKQHANGDLSLRFHFPSDWYEFENKAYLTYAPERCVLPAALARAVERGEHHPELERYIGKFVVIGMPDRYCDSGQRSGRAVASRGTDAPRPPESSNDRV